jgi:hypothetical protein
MKAIKAMLKSMMIFGTGRLLMEPQTHFGI